jgi:hypothetical protein
MVISLKARAVQASDRDIPFPEINLQCLFLPMIYILSLDLLMSSLGFWEAAAAGKVSYKTIIPPQ